MLKEVLHYLDIKPGQVVLDMTFGGGGHTKAVLDADSDVTILALDRDPAAISLAQQLAKEHPGQVKPLLGRFSDLEVLLSGINVKEGSIDAVLLDAGCSSMQMDQAERGFSLSKDGPLDMRMDGERFADMPCAADVVNTLDQQALTSILTAYGEERHAWKIASAIVEARRVKPITRTQQLASVVADLRRRMIEMLQSIGCVCVSVSMGEKDHFLPPLSTHGRTDSSDLHTWPLRPFRLCASL
ncbi:12S rRNA N4-methylcytidine (m4C) methyltransferase-like isoform X2 [Entelurus aequoreus]|uniref:12S rRNA N4-methylcytidine (m4C) methyltransferase-like isoform X2 n=1 Tax=Entelurus aequoreus TaxID=161455 RepID=UPI002B1D863D|nr:12S rRNA N4-methylcytidine (m4C) methyltransferase-like isoform X2 [Entelurus aequoreus]